MNNEQYAWIKQVDNDKPLFFILGPCVMENEKDTLKIAEFLKNLSTRLNFNLIFKGSFDKANRTAMKGFRGVSMDEGLKILDKIRQQFDLPIMTDVHETYQVEQVASVVDILQIPAFLCRQTDLLCASAKTGKPVHVKKGQFEAPESMVNVIGKIEAMGNPHTWLCERGFSFGYNNLVVDYRNFPIMKKLNKPVTFDVTHSVQRPGGLGCASGGDSEFIEPLTLAAIVQGIAGLYLMVHQEPEKARCCGPVSARLDNKLETFIKKIIELDNWVKKA